MSSLGFHVERSREQRNPRATAATAAAAAAAAAAKSSRSEIAAPKRQIVPVTQQHYSTYNRSAYVRGSSIGDRGPAKPSAESHARRGRNPHGSGGDEPPGLNSFSIGKNGRSGGRPEPAPALAKVAASPAPMAYEGLPQIIEPLKTDSRRGVAPIVCDASAGESGIPESVGRMVDSLKLDIQRESHARKEMEIALKSILSEIDMFRKELVGREGSVAADIQRDFRDTQQIWSAKFARFEAQSNVDRRLDDIRGDLQTYLGDVNDMLHWYYGVVESPDGLDVVSKDGTPPRVLRRVGCGDTLLLHPPMKRGDGGAVSMSCRIVDEKGQVTTGEVQIAKGDTLLVSQFNTAPQR